MAYNGIVFECFFNSFGHGLSPLAKTQSNECKGQRVVVELANETEAHKRRTLVAHVQRV